MQVVHERKNPTNEQNLIATWENNELEIGN